MIEFPYVALPSKQLGKVLKPFIKVQLNYKKTHKITLPVVALIDSGADVCFCSDFIGTWLGINFNKIKEKAEFTAANGGKFEAKPVTVNLVVGDKNYPVKFYFTDVLPNYSPIILGQIGFFDSFRVVFDSKKGIIQLD